MTNDAARIELGGGYVLLRYEDGITHLALYEDAKYPDFYAFKCNLAQLDIQQLQAFAAAMQPQVAAGDEELAQTIKTHCVLWEHNPKNGLINYEGFKSGHAAGLIGAYRTAHTAKLEAELDRLQGVVGELEAAKAIINKIVSAKFSHGEPTKDVIAAVAQIEKTLKRAKAEGV